MDIDIMGFAYPLTAIVTLLIGILLFVFSARVGKERARTGIKAPTMGGDNTLECAVRVHMNTIEQLVIFLPAMWLMAMIVDDQYASIVGAIWIVGRMLYSRGYMSDPSKRSMGFLTGFLAFVIATLWTLYETIMMVV